MSSAVGDIVSPQLSSFLFAFYIEIITFTSKHFLIFFRKRSLLFDLLVYLDEKVKGGKDKNQIHFIHFVCF